MRDSSIRGSTREGSVREESFRETTATEDAIGRSLSRGSSARSMGSKTPVDRPPAYVRKDSAAKGAAEGYVIEESLTTKETSNVQSSVAGYGGGAGRSVALEVNYDDDGKCFEYSLNADAVIMVLLEKCFSFFLYT